MSTNMMMSTNVIISAKLFVNYGVYKTVLYT